MNQIPNKSCIDHEPKSNQTENLHSQSKRIFNTLSAKTIILMFIGLSLLVFSSLSLFYYLPNHYYLTDCYSEECLAPIIFYFTVGFLSFIVSLIFILFAKLFKKYILTILLIVILMIILSIVFYYLLPQLNGVAALRRDEIRGRDISYIRGALSDYYIKNHAYPLKLKNLKSSERFSTNDPKNNEPYSYLLNIDGTYKLCVNKESSRKHRMIDYTFSDSNKEGDAYCFGPNPVDKDYFK